MDTVSVKEEQTVYVLMKSAAEVLAYVSILLLFIFASSSKAAEGGEFEAC